MFRVISDKHSNHNLPLGAIVTPLDPAELEGWQRIDGAVVWYTQGGDGDEVAIDPRDLAIVEVSA